MKLPRILARDPSGGGLVETTVPDSPVYVVMDDDTWGRIFKTKVVNVFPCLDFEQAELVLKYAKASPFQKRARIVDAKPEPGDDRTLVVMAPADVRAWAEFGRSPLLSG